MKHQILIKHKFFFFFLNDLMPHTIYLKRKGAFKGHIKNGLFFNVFVFFLHLWCYACRSTIHLWGKINTAHYILVSWAFTLVKALVLQKRKLVVNGPASLICSFKTCMYFQCVVEPIWGWQSSCDGLWAASGIMGPWQNCINSRGVSSFN